MRRHLTLLLTGLLLLATGFVRADHLRPHLLLSARLDGAQEVPAVTTPGQGVASFTLNATRDTLFINATFSGLSGPITNAHTHLGRRGVSGGVVTSLLSMVQGNRLQGFLTGTDLDNQKLRRYLRGDYYINIHTAANPGGEIRGQIEVETDYMYAAVLSGAQEVPPVTTPALGVGSFVLSQDKTKMNFRAVFDRLSGPATNAHFHTGAPGVSGPVILPLFTYVVGNTMEGVVDITPAILTALEAGNIYINVHTAANLGGEIRGQLVSRARVVAHDARFDGTQMVPPITTTAKAVATAELNPALDTLRFNLSFAGLSGPPANLDLYVADAGQTNVGATRIGRVPLAGLTNNAFSVTFPNLNVATANALLSGRVNMVLTTAANPEGEIRGQVYRVAREGYTFTLSGSQERPTPVASPGTGSGVVSIDRDQSNVHFMLAWTGLTGPAQSGHFHTGLSTQAGPVVFDLGQYFDNTAAPASAQGFWQATGNPAPNAARPFTLRRSIQFRRDSMYVNLHTAQFLGGEIRGQVFRGARNLRVVLSAQPAALAAETFTSYPNPFRTGITIRFEARTTGPATVQVADLLGRTVATQAIQIRAGANAHELALPQVKAGVYLVTVEAAGSKIVSRIMKE
ncbi:Por secretion system C-terminal sorting domain-containing protein [Hymenobacter daecheongensis DSM 21074]|uniref:Por secretion system C-terminal sorting domain-containing protein n=1 Tax=Hymenobacter daecheongensis DSM 21074 TaxID=1121955 RepID=A0A1M6EGP6_9BACT|nr:CHRD domain-containing protein [Hymenobacter daecheongensis]SHI84644.1 Por secretion system C-terminal sorting domain-containing protein [Hymenobacter daecheongensis DSM 21074]